jgi:hypothetical protein
MRTENIFFKMRISDLKSCSPKYIFQDLKYIFFQDVKCENWNIFFKIWNVRISDLKIADLRSEIYFSNLESQIWNIFFKSRIADLKCEMENRESEIWKSEITYLKYIFFQDVKCENWKYISSRREMWDLKYIFQMWDLESQIWNVKSRISDLKCENWNVKWRI